MVEREALLLEVGHERRDVLGHVPVDIDDGVAEPPADLSGRLRH